MAGTLTVQNIQGPTSGDNANKIIVPDGQTLELPSGSTLDVSGGTLVPSTGQVVQVKSAVTQTATIVTAVSTWTDVGLSTSITPTSASNKILVYYASQNIANNAAYIGVRLLRGSTSISRNYAYNNTSNWMPSFGGIIILDSPATTSSVTYKIQAYQSTSGGDVRHNYTGPNTGYASITLMEIAQ